MHKVILFVTAAFVVAGCATAPDRVVSSSLPTSITSPLQPAAQVRPARVSNAPQAVPNSTTASLKPGPTYVASFPEADRRAACRRLDYREGSAEFSRCLVGDFPENPYFAQAGN